MGSSGHTLNTHNLKRQNHQELDELGSRGVLQAYLILQSISSSFHPIHFANLIFPKYFYHVSHLLPKCYRFQFLIFPISAASCFHSSTNFSSAFFKRPKAPNRQVSTSAANSTSSPFLKLCSLALQIWLHAISSHLFESSLLHGMLQAAVWEHWERSPGIQGKPGYILSSRPALATDWKLS